MNETTDDVLLTESSEPEAPAERPRRGGGRLLVWVIVLALLSGGGWWLWEYIQELRANAAIAREQSDLITALRQQIGELDSRISQNHQSQRGMSSRLDDASSANRVLRDEMLAVAERAAALEEAIHRLAESRERSATTVRLDEVEFLLRFGQERLALFGDMEGAINAYDLAAETLAGIEDPAFAGLSQSVAQELDQLRTAPPSPRLGVLARLDAIAAEMASLPLIGNEELPDEAGDASTLRSILSNLVKVRRVDAGGAALTPSRQAAQRTALQLEFGMARVAVERGDEAAFRASLARVQDQIQLGYVTSDASVAAVIAQLRALGETPLKTELPALGSSLRELRALRTLRRGTPSRAIAPRPLPVEPSIERAVEAPVE